MKANELMIGDWVEQVQDLVPFAPIKIEEIKRECVIFGNGLCKLNFNEINPIPLTEDILDKNFKDIAEPHQRIYGGRWVYYDEYIEIEITEYTDGIWQVVVDEIEMSGLPTWKMYVSYVHELQHALRLCNIEKEIEL